MIGDGLSTGLAGFRRPLVSRRVAGATLSLARQAPTIRLYPDSFFVI